MQRRRAWILLAIVLMAVRALPQFEQPVEETALNLSTEQKAALVSAIGKWLDDKVPTPPPDPLSPFNFFRARLAANGPPAIVAVSVDQIGMDRNGLLLIFRREGGSDAPILDSVAEDYSLLKTRHNHYRDVALSVYMGSNSSNESVWYYDGRQYRVHSCTEIEDSVEKSVRISECQ
jgi:hypothetical protein